MGTVPDTFYLVFDGLASYHKMTFPLTQEYQQLEQALSVEDMWNDTPFGVTIQYSYIFV
jgi:hypothetical protein